MQDAGNESWDTYVVEHYGPGASAETLRRTAGNVRRTAAEMARQGKSVRYDRSTIVPADEAFITTFDATSEEFVREAYERAGVTFERISRAIQPDGR